MCDFAYVNLPHEKVRQSQVEERTIATNDLHSMNASCRGSRRYNQLQRLNPILIVVLTPTVVFREDADCSVGARRMAT